MIKNMVFDMGGVLMDFDPEKFADMRGLEGDDRKLLLDTIFYSQEWQQLDAGIYNDDSFAALMKTKLPERLWTEMEELVRRWPVLSVEGTMDVVKELKDRGYRILLLSNAGPRHDEYFPLLPGSEYFEGKAVSSYVGAMKPHPEIYRIFFKKFGVDPAECLFVDDVPANIQAGKDQGMDGIVFQNAGQLREELVRRKIL